MVIITGLIGMVTVIIATLNERRREIAIFRALGARRETLLGLLMIESGFYGVVGLITGYILHIVMMLLANAYVQSHYGIALTVGWPNESMIYILLGFLLTATVLGVLPGYRAYRQSLSDGLSANL